MTGLRPRSAIGVLLLAGALLTAAGSAAAPSVDFVVTVVYSGTASNTMAFTNKLGERDRTDEATVSWRFSYTGPISKLSGFVTFPTQSASGLFSQTFAAPNADSSCAYALAAGKGNGMSATPQGGGALVIDFAVPNRVQPGDPSAHLVAKKTGGGDCAPLQGGLPVIGNWAASPHPAAPRVEYDPGLNPRRTWKFTAKRTWNDGRKNTYRLSSTVAISPGKKPPIGAVTTPTQVRTLGAQLLKQRLPYALYPCFTAATGVVVFTAVGVAIGPVVGGTMVAVAGPVCAQMIRDLRELDLVVNDPPVPGYAQVAQVPKVVSQPVAFVPCAQYPQAGRQLCGRLQGAAQGWADAGRSLGATLKTLATTVGRESAAAKAGDTTALRKQQQAAIALVPVVKAASRSERAAAKKLAAVLRSAGARGTLTPAQSERAVSVVRDRLRRAGVGGARIDAIVGSRARPGRIDALAQLGAA